MVQINNCAHAALWCFLCIAEYCQFTPKFLAWKTKWPATAKGDFRRATGYNSRLHFVLDIVAREDRASQCFAYHLEIYLPALQFHFYGHIYSFSNLVSFKKTQLTVKIQLIYIQHCLTEMQWKCNRVKNVAWSAKSVAWFLTNSQGPGYTSSKKCSLVKKL